MKHRPTCCTHFLPSTSLTTGESTSDSSANTLDGDTNGDGVVNAEDLDCEEGTVPNEDDASTNLRCVSGAARVFSFSGVVRVGALGVAAAAGLLLL